MDIKELHKRVRKVEIKTRGLTKQIFAGEYDSAFKGRGMSFSEVREYAYGDDVRNIDWNVTARTGDPYIKVFEEERELTVILMIDVSNSMQFGSGDMTKRDLATEIAAILAFSAQNNNDKVGAILFSDKIERYLPPQKGKTHILRIIRDLIEVKSDAKSTNLDLPCDFLNKVQKKRSIAFMLSDHIGQMTSTTIRRTARKHDFIAINIYDQAEMMALAFGAVHVSTLESGKNGFLWMKGPDKMPNNDFANRQEALSGSFKKYNADFISIAASRDYVSQLISFFKRR